MLFLIVLLYSLLGFVPHDNGLGAAGAPETGLGTIQTQNGGCPSCPPPPCPPPASQVLARSRQADDACGPGCQNSVGPAKMAWK